MKEIKVRTKPEYSVWIGAGLLHRIGEMARGVSKADAAVIISDDIVAPLYGAAVQQSLEQAGFQVHRFVFPNGESSKNHTTLLQMYHFLCEQQITRSDLLIALGGGVVGDITGYCAATYLRGVDYLQIPTTLLAQVDSSVGGKTAVNIAAGKNLVGAFKQPRLVLCDTDTLATLSEENFADGMGEVIKYGMIRDQTLFKQLATENIDLCLEEVIARCVDIKRSVVEIDETDHGERMMLNFGHTLGHAIEKEYDFKKYMHGSAVAIGMVRITQRSEQYGLTESGTTETLTNCLKRYKLPVEDKITDEALIANSLTDKKTTGDKIRIVLCKTVGDCFIQTLSKEEYRQFVQGGYHP